LGSTREVPVELIVNGAPVASKKVVADGSLRPLTFDVPIERSSWIAVRVYPSSHSNPIYVLIGERPVRASRASAEWCLTSVDQCWTQKAPKISERELTAARMAYDHAREVYRRLVAECMDSTTASGRNGSP
jgi:hypothetical protein